MGMSQKRSNKMKSKSTCQGGQYEQRNWPLCLRMPATRQPLTKQRADTWLRAEECGPKQSVNHSTPGRKPAAMP